MSPQISHGLFGFLLTSDLTLRGCNNSLIQAICRMGICLFNMPQTFFFFPPRKAYWYRRANIYIFIWPKCLKAILEFLHFKKATIKWFLWSNSEVKIKNCLFQHLYVSFTVKLSVSRMRWLIIIHGCQLTYLAGHIGNWHRLCQISLLG